MHDQLNIYLYVYGVGLRQSGFSGELALALRASCCFLKIYMYVYAVAHVLLLYLLLLLLLLLFLFLLSSYKAKQVVDLVFAFLCLLIEYLICRNMANNDSF